MSLSVSVSRSWNADLVDRWNLLWSGLDVCPLLAPTWAYAARHLEPAEPWLISVTDDARLVGYAALGLDRRGIVRCLQPYGDKITDYWDVVAEPSKRSAVLAAVAGVLRAKSACWDEVLVRRTLFADTARALARVGSQRQGTVTIAPRLESVGSFDEWLTRLPSQRRTNIRRAVRRVKEGEVALCAVGPDEGIQAAVARWQAIRHDRFDSIGRTLNSVQRDPGFVPFVTEVAENLVASGHMSIYELSASGCTAASWILLRDSTTVYYWLGGHLPAFDQLSPLTVLIAEVVREHAGSDMALDFMLGDERYKEKAFGAVPIRSVGVRIVNRRPRSFVAVGISGVGTSRPFRASKLMTSSSGRKRLWNLAAEWWAVKRERLVSSPLGRRDGDRPAPTG
jgi:CelD/BcsL family acetyltransferase involved in cellulose biosynthesis